LMALPAQLLERYDQMCLSCSFKIMVVLITSFN
jgi:hypothetical protein